MYGIVQGAGGTMTVVSEVGRGTTFTAHLPQAEVPEGTALLEAGADRAAAPEPEGNGARVVLVEDDEGMLKLGEAVLSEAGYDVRAAHDAKEALELLAVDGRLDLLVTDISMPVMGGKDLAAAVRRLVPEVPVLYMTGYDRALVATGSDEESERRTDFVQKPFAIGEFRAKAAGLLAASS